MKLVRFAILASMLSLFAIFAVLYPDAPIRPCEPGYCGRQGQARTEADYKLFTTLETSLFIVWPVGLLARFILRRAERLRAPNPVAKHHPRFGGR